jgi:hypothetical protein
LKNEPLGKIDMKILKVAVALGLATSLSGCLTTDDAVDVDVIAAANSLLERTNFAYSVDTTDLTSKATMTGFITGPMMEMPGGGGLKVEEITFQESTSQAFAGQMSLEADFDSGAVTGSTSNLGLYEYSDNCMKRSFTGCDATQLSALDGDLALNAHIDNTSNDGRGGFIGNLSGVVRGDYSDDYVTGTYTAAVDLRANGRFLQDSNGIMADAELSGSADYIYEGDDGSVYSGEVPIGGDFVVADESGFVVSD